MEAIWFWPRRWRPAGECQLWQRRLGLKQNSSCRPADGEVAFESGQGKSSPTPSAGAACSCARCGRPAVSGVGLCEHARVGLQAKGLRGQTCRVQCQYQEAATDAAGLGRGVWLCRHVQARPASKCGCWFWQGAALHTHHACRAQQDKMVLRFAYCAWCLCTSIPTARSNSLKPA